MSIKCLADANPPASIRWFKDTINLSRHNIVESIVQNQTHRNGTLSGSEVRFEPVKKENAGLYSCKAINVIGESTPAIYRLDIQCNCYLFIFYSTHKTIIFFNNYILIFQMVLD